MHAADTNVVIRYLVADDAAQSARARALIAAGPVWLGLTVLLECEWVLRSAYGLPRTAIVGALRTLAGQDNVQVENPAVLRRALDVCEAGMDFSDALHVCCTEGAAEAFWTFDAGLVKQAQRLGVESVCAL